MSSGEQVPDDLLQHRFALLIAQVKSVRWSFATVQAVIGALAWNQVPAPVVLGWLVLIFSVQALRIRGLSHLAARPAETGRHKVRAAVAWNLALGLAFGASAGFMAWLDTTRSAILTMIVVSTASGAVAISGPLLQVYLAYTLSILLPFAALWSTRDGWLGIGVALLLGTFIAVQYRLARQVGATFDESFEMRRRNETLVLQLTDARDEAEAASRAKTRFLAAASHDLRQPLHALSLQSSALLLDPRSEDTPEIAAAMAQSIDDVSALLNSLLDISKLDAGTLVADLRPIQLSRLIDTLARSFEPLARDRGLAFRLVNPPGVIAVTDPLLIERVLRNLLDNSLKFTERGCIALRLRRRSDGLEVAVVDTGVGIAPEAQRKVFEEFYQIDRHAVGHTQGLGLGLSIVARLAAMLGMTVRLQSRPGRGTKVAVRLPLRNTALPTVPADLQPAPSEMTLQGVRVLVIDDEPAIRHGMATLLHRLGCETAAAGSIREALARAEAQRPQVVLADYRLDSGENGIEAVARLRQHWPGLPAVLISGDTAPDRLREADASGLTLLHKPVSLVRLKQALAQELRRS